MPSLPSWNQMEDEHRRIEHNKMLIRMAANDLAPPIREAPTDRPWYLRIADYLGSEDGKAEVAALLLEQAQERVRIISCENEPWSMTTQDGKRIS
jgi:hypothetical protein